LKQNWQFNNDVLASNFKEIFHSIIDRKE